MHITILALGSRGDIQPYASLGNGLKTAGHQVRFITFENYASLIAANELDFHSIRGNAQALVAHAGANTLALIRSFSSLAKGYVSNLSSQNLGETDLIINQLPVGLFGVDLAEKHGIPMVLASVIPLARTRAFPVMGFPRIPLPGYNKATYYFGEQMAWQMFRGTINHWRKHTLSLPPRPMAGYFGQLGTQRIPILNGFSSQVVQRPADWGEHIYTSGYWFPEDKGWQSPADLMKFLDAGDPPVFIGFGSMPVKDPQHMTAVILEALEQTGQRCILHVGWGGLGDQALPEHVFKLDYAPYGWLFPRMAMVIHHGGSGTTSFGLRSGVPACVVSFVFDQHYWGERIAALGVGPKPIRHNHVSVEKLSQAIQQGVSDVPMRQRAAELGGLIRAEDGIAHAGRIIERIVRAWG
jgi:UDP:flavonoid glycosyltransferase YjiC (YdhE family)